MTGSDFTWCSRDGLNLYARRYGAPNAKLPVICIPGLTRNSKDFDLVAPWIAGQGRDVLAVDLRGRGRSDRDSNPKRYTPKTYADDVMRLLDAIGAKQALFVGTSLGGLVTMSLALSNVSRIGGAVINDVAPRVAKAGLARIRGYAGKATPVNTWADAAAYAKRTNGVAFPDAPDAFWDGLARRLFRDEGGQPVLDYDPLIFQAPNPIVSLIAEPILWSAFKRLGRAGPLLLVKGELTDIIDASTIVQMERLAPRMEVASVRRVGHAPNLDEVEAREAMQRFFATAR